jgi:predicted regulator of Ras-like GTPase activity (Roadblock/LC7/MglB family)
MGIGAPDRARCNAALDHLLQSNDGISIAMLALRDGRPFMEKHRQGLDSGKFAAMASSLVALGHGVLKDLKAGPLDHVLIDGAEGKLVISSVSGSGGLLILAVLAARDTRLGLVLGHARHCALAVAAAFP